MSDLYWLTDEQMARLEPYFLKSHGKPRVDDRRVLSDIVSSTATGYDGAMPLGSMAHTRRSTTGGSDWAKEVSSSA
jgi:transposase